MTRAKICGVTTPEALRGAADGGAAFIGLVSFEPSPRHLSVQAMADLLRISGRTVPVVVLTVDVDDARLVEIADAVRPDFIQLHGAETPTRAAEVRALTGAGIIKALPISTGADVATAAGWEGHADHLLLDARPPSGPCDDLVEPRSAQRQATPWAFQHHEDPLRRCRFGPFLSKVGGQGGEEPR